MKHILTILIAAVVAVAVGSCNKAPINGHLDGMWQIMSIDFTSAPTMTPDQYYFSFYRHTANVSNARGFRIAANLVYDEEASRLSLEFPYAGQWLGDIGIKAHTPYTAEFKILKLTNKQLVMVLNDSATYTLRKF